MADPKNPYDKWLIVADLSRYRREQLKGMSRAWERCADAYRPLLEEARAEVERLMLEAASHVDALNAALAEVERLRVDLHEAAENCTRALREASICARRRCVCEDERDDLRARVEELEGADEADQVARATKLADLTVASLRLSHCTPDERAVLSLAKVWEAIGSTKGCEADRTLAAAVSKLPDGSEADR
jgi:chromosome segregation ATPase